MKSPIVIKQLTTDLSLDLRNETSEGGADQSDVANWLGQNE